MSPILRRLAGLLGRTAERSAPGPDAPSPSAGGRRRGSRGRGGGGQSPPPTTAPPPNNARADTRGGARPPQGAPRPDNRATTNGANGGGGANYGGSSYDRRRPRRRDLDQPLPEDVAFRPPAEGGDRSILPSRRRPPPGLRATKRVLLAGRRFVPRGSGGAANSTAELIDLPGDELPSVIVTPPAPGETKGPESVEGGERSGRRRRGRRGGRGRNRGGPAGGSAPPASGD